LPAFEFLVPKLSVLIYIYTGFYLLFSVSTIATDIKDKEPWWDIAASVVLLPLGAVGIFLFLFGVNDPSIKSIWKVVSVVVVVGEVITNVISRRLTLAGKTSLDPEKISQWAILGADLIAVVVLVPMFALNLLFAFR
jgi:hypothetical protein